MTQVNNSVSDLYWSNGTATEKKQTGTNSQTLDQEDFFALLTQQLAYQDPSSPVENSEMISQMSAFQTSEGIASLNTSFEDLNSTMTSSAALQASTLVGKQVLVPVEHSYSSGSGFDGVAITSGGATNMTVTIKNSKEEVVRTIGLGDGSGNVRFSWDGKDKNGEVAPEGSYTVTVQGNQDNTVKELPTATYSKVESVSLAGGVNDVVLNLNGLGGLRLSDVLEVSGG